MYKSKQLHYRSVQNGEIYNPRIHRQHMPRQVILRAAARNPKLSHMSFIRTVPAAIQAARMPHTPETLLANEGIDSVEKLMELRGLSSLATARIYDKSFKLLTEVFAELYARSTHKEHAHLDSLYDILGLTPGDIHFSYTEEMKMLQTRRYRHLADPEHNPLPQVSYVPATDIARILRCLEYINRFKYRTQRYIIDAKQIMNSTPMPVIDDFSVSKNALIDLKKELTTAYYYSGYIAAIVHILSFDYRYSKNVDIDRLRTLIHDAYPELCTGEFNDHYRCVLDDAMKIILAGIDKDTLRRSRYTAKRSNATSFFS